MKNSNYFWVGFADLMSSLFFLMLILFVVTIGFLQFKIKENKKNIIKNETLYAENITLINSLKSKEKQLNIEIKRLNRLLKIEEQFKPLEDSPFFVYLKNCKKFVASKLIGKEIFEPKQTVIKKEYIDETIGAGRILEEFFIEMRASNPDLSYLLVIEGNMANELDKSISIDDNWGYKKSYQRALEVYNLWLKNEINFRSFNVEVMICGSGFNGLCRDDAEQNNKRFSIQIIPKTENQTKNI